MPFELQKLEQRGTGIIRTSVFTNTNHDLTNLNGTMLLAKLNGRHLGIFVSGKMKEEYPQIGGKDPHAETNLIQALKDTATALKTANELRPSGNVLSIKLSKSPCTSCKDALIFFNTSFCKPLDIKIRMKIMALYNAEGETTACHSMAELMKGGIVCIPWRIEDRYAESADTEGSFFSERDQTKTGMPHELSGLKLDQKEIELMQKRSDTLSEKVPSLATPEQYKGVKTPLTAGQKTELSKLISEKIATIEAKEQEIDLRLADLEKKRESAETKIKKIKGEVEKRQEPKYGATTLRTRKRVQPYTGGSRERLAKSEKQVDTLNSEEYDLWETLDNLAAQKLLLQTELDSLKK